MKIRTRPGMTGVALSSYKADREAGHNARATVSDPPAEKKGMIRVELLEDWYCLSAGEEIVISRRLFIPDSLHTEQPHSGKDGD